MAGPAANVFISYKAEDRSRLAPLVSALEAEGFSVWWDAHIGGGTNWRQDIEEHLDAAKCVIVAWSKRSVAAEGEFVRDEAMRAKRRHSYLPIRIDDVEPPLGFGEVQALSLKDWHGDRSDPRYVALADAVRERITGEHVPHQRTRSSQPLISRRAAIAGGAGVGAVAIVGAGGWMLLKPAPANAKRIAVLPFADLSPARDQTYFTEGISEELRAALSRIGLQVIGRNSCDAVKDLDIKSAAAKLDVANILTGSVRRAAETIRINAQLVSGTDGVERWAQTFDRAPGDVIKIQTEIASKVAQALSIALGREGRAALTLGGTTDSVAQDLVLQARKLRREDSSATAYRKGLALADAAIARDPNYADAHVLRAIMLNALASQFATDLGEAASQRALANDSANRALEIAPRLASAHGALAAIAQAGLNFRGSLVHLNHALALSPDDPDVLAFATNNLQWFGRGQEALRLANRYVALDPLDPQAYRRKAQVLHVLRQYPQSVEAGRKAGELSPKVSRLWAGNSLLMMGRPREALAEFEAMSEDDMFRWAGEAIVAARTGDRIRAEQIMTRMNQKFGAAATYQYAQVRAQMGQKDRAFAELDRAYSIRDGGLIYLKLDSFMDPIRSDPRFAALVEKLNFP